MKMKKMIILIEGFFFISLFLFGSVGFQLDASYDLSIYVQYPASKVSFQFDHIEN